MILRLKIVWLYVRTYRTYIWVLHNQYLLTMLAPQSAKTFKTDWLSLNQTYNILHRDYDDEHNEDVTVML